MKTSQSPTDFPFCGTAAIAQTRDEKRDAAYREGAAFLRSLDITSQTELTRVLDIAMNPNSLFADHQNKLRASNTSVSNVLCTNPLSAAPNQQSAAAALSPCTSTATGPV